MLYTVIFISGSTFGWQWRQYITLSEQLRTPKQLKMSEEGVRKMLRNLQLQEQQKLVVDYKIQCYIMVYLSQIQHSVAVAPVYHFV